MASSKGKAHLPEGCRLLMVVGSYGSGKTEISVNLAIQMSEAGRRVQLADLDIVNPYFRSRSARKLMESHGIRVVIPPGAQSYADLPIIVPEIRGMLGPGAGQLSLFDVGGDAVGARLLSSFREPLGDRPYELWQVVNSRRPFTRDEEGCLRMMADIEQASRLRVTGFVANSHLVGETTPEVVCEGARLASRLAERTGVPLRLVCAMGDLEGRQRLAGLDAPMLWMARRMLPPWLRPARSAESRDEPIPAGRPVPIGRPAGAK
ncbi:MAG: cobalamin biosynthesis protein CbiA [Deltaproteobacteria bacterium]|nr:cobalamin biosynthesis protein CbiA [Deltaproteobacteria bacterium]